ncbi:RagB/SusD family nutrient uptake outer membrane protein [Sphingobacterium siyangense]|uniref:RagB/SusD family nutrient uptake outer membrane protein n=1 Tax=Sphingobacterium siyangense TaxID=459529 RepID=UPI00200D37F9|nr:RagB/SusD family nutrient uptake outer membrane protein [Sphingobacterium siyangense]UQA74973.1 RagB/SusD family nutrient uptake outer membrane protein [Sphingobacterium siyangense]
MKINYFNILLCAGLFLNSCSLDEYNPSGVTVDKVAENKAGFDKLINSCYFDLPRYFYGRNFLLVTEGGTDLWTSDLNSNNNQNYLKYASGGSMSIDMAKDYWNGAYDAINYCNIVIGRVDQVKDFSSEQEKQEKVAQAYFLRGLYYFHLVEQFGPCPLNLTETTTANTAAIRTPVLEIYEKCILPDLRFAAEHLPVGPTEAGRPSQKAALGLLAKACLQTKEYNANQYLEEALLAAKKLIDNQAGYNVRLYASFIDNFNAANNKKNAEALYQIPYSQEYGSTNVYDHNNDFKRFYCTPTTFGAIQLSGFQTEVGRWSGGTFMPSKYLLDVFKNSDNTLDPRYGVSFQTQWTSNANYNWSRDAVVQFDRDENAVSVGANLPKGSLAIKIARSEETGYAEEKKTQFQQHYIWLDLEDVYGSDNKVKMKYTRTNQQPGQVDNPFIGFYPSLVKFNSGSLISPKANNFTSDAYATVMRLGEVYLIAAEASFYLNGANATAASYINVLRDRVGARQITAGDLTAQFILDERARELCGEYTRWYDLKRMGKLNRSYLMAVNPDVGQYFKDGVHGLRPIPQGQMDAVSNPGEFVQNNGY